MENEELLSKPQTDLPLPEKEIPAHIDSKSAFQGLALEGYGKNIFRNKIFILFVVLSFLVAFLIGGFALGKNQSNKQSPLGSPEPTAQAATPTPDLYTEGTRSATADWKTYEGDGFSFKYPSAFEDKNGLLTYYSTKVNTGPGGGVIYLNIEKKQMPLQKAIASIPGVNEKQDTTINNIPGVILTGYTGIGGSVYFSDILFEIGDQTITISMSSPDQDTIPEIQSIFKQILSTFKFTDSSASPTPSKEGVACTQDVKQCPDGSYVSRQGPKCELTACPE